MKKTTDEGGEFDIWKETVGIGGSDEKQWGVAPVLNGGSDQ